MLLFWGIAALGPVPYDLTTLQLPKRLGKWEHSSTRLWLKFINHQNKNSTHLNYARPFQICWICWQVALESSDIAHDGLSIFTPCVRSTGIVPKYRSDNSGHLLHGWFKSEHETVHVLPLATQGVLFGSIWELDTLRSLLSCSVCPNLQS